MGNVPRGSWQVRALPRQGERRETIFPVAGARVGGVAGRAKAGRGRAHPSFFAFFFLLLFIIRMVTFICLLIIIDTYPEWTN